MPIGVGTTSPGPAPVGMALARGEATIALVLVATEDPSSTADVDVAAGGTAAPRLAPGTELLGQYQDSGCIEAPYLVRRAEGGMVEVSHLLYQVTASIDGDRDVAEVARRVSGQTRRHLSPESVEYLIDRKLRPLGVVDEVSPGRTAATTRVPLLALTVRTAIIPQCVVRAASSALRPLFLPAVVLGALVALGAADAWLVSSSVGHGLRDVLFRPGWLLAVFGLTILGGFLHELGHATGSRYGGASPGVIGAGIYLIWPAFYNDLNDSYRLNRRGRLRADLGGVYFNVLFIVALAGAYGLCHWPPLIAALVVQHVMVLQQFLPFVRLDGYYIVSDLVGVPNLFGRVRPVLSSLVPGRERSASVSGLKPKVRVVVTAWVLLTVPLLFACTVLFAARLPGMISTGRGALLFQVRTLLAAWHAGDPVSGVVSALQLVVLTIPCIGLAVTLARILGRSWSQGQRLSERGRPPVTARRLLALVTAVNLMAGIAAAVGFVEGPGQRRTEAVATISGFDGHPVVQVEVPVPDPPPPVPSTSIAPSPESPPPSAPSSSAPSTTVASPVAGEEDPRPLEPPGEPAVRSAPATDRRPSGTLQPSSAQVAQAISEVKQRMPFFNPTESQAAEFGKQVCAAFDQGTPYAETRAGVLQAAAKLPLIKITPADADLVLRTTVRLYCPWHEPELA